MIYANPWELHQTGENLQVVCRGQLRNGCAKPVFDRALSRVKRPQNPYKIEHPHYRPVVVARAGAYPGAYPVGAIFRTAQAQERTIGATRRRAQP
jgi:hypothetical protein